MVKLNRPRPMVPIRIAIGPCQAYPGPSWPANPLTVTHLHCTALGEAEMPITCSAGAEKRPASQLVALRALDSIRRRLYRSQLLLNNENTRRPYNLCCCCAIRSSGRSPSHHFENFCDMQPCNHPVCSLSERRVRRE